MCGKRTCHITWFSCCHLSHWCCVVLWLGRQKQSSTTSVVLSRRFAHSRSRLIQMWLATWWPRRLVQQRDSSISCSLLWATRTRTRTWPVLPPRGLQLQHQQSLKPSQVSSTRRQATLQLIVDLTVLSNHMALLDVLLVDGLGSVSVWCGGMDIKEIG